VSNTSRIVAPRLPRRDPANDTINPLLLLSALGHAEISALDEARYRHLNQLDVLIH
jgi:hypothetical protein